VKELGETYRIDEIGYDPWNSSKLITELTEDGFQMIPVRQGYASMSPPTKELLTQVLGRHMIHGNHPVLKWMAGNLAVVMDDAGNVKPSRPSSTDKIDGMVALIMGLDRAIRHEGEAESIYETERLTVL
jgi:phage terminase large subunit-like protein